VTVDQLLFVVGAAIYGVLGTLHLLYTLFTRRFDPRDPAARAAMEATTPVLTRDTTMWRAWVGFNASHSLGAIVLAAFVLLLAVRHMPVLVAAPEFAWLAVVASLSYVALARAYWFRIPLVGAAIASACFLAAAVRLAQP
jgi:hypothetical protein